LSTHTGLQRPARLERRSGRPDTRADGREERRQRAVQALGLGEDVRAERFDRITRVATTLLGTQMSTITVLDRDRACYPGVTGFHGDPLPREQTFCHTATLQDRLTVVPDALLDPRFAHLDAVQDGTVRFYAGAPLRDPVGNVVGVLCVFDPEPGVLEGDRRTAFLDLAVWAEQELVSSADSAAAARAQASLLPADPLHHKGWEVAGICVPALAVGGDFYDYGVWRGVLHLGLGDVMGKGTGAALMGAGVRAAVRAVHLDVVAGADLGHTATRVSLGIGPDLERAGSFAALFEAAIDLSTGHVRYVDAGLGLAVAVRSDGRVDRLVSDDRPFGVLPGDTWQQHTGCLDPGDFLVVLSDGLLDLVDDPASWWGAVGDLVSGCRSADEVLRRVAGLTRDGVPVDDVTVLVVHRGEARAGASS
jgi:hypothetical protein